jgi:hypothetical protein
MHPRRYEYALPPAQLSSVQRGCSDGDDVTLVAAQRFAHATSAVKLGQALVAFDGLCAVRTQPNTRTHTTHTQIHTHTHTHSTNMRTKMDATSDSTIARVLVAPYSSKHYPDGRMTTRSTRHETNRGSMHITPSVKSDAEVENGGCGSISHHHASYPEESL